MLIIIIKSLKVSSRIDFYLVSKSITNWVVKANTKVFNSPDHKAVVLDLRILDQFLFLGNQAQLGSLEHEVFFELDLPPASSIFLFQARHHLRGRVTSAYPQSSSVPIYPARCKSSSVSISHAWVQIALGCKSSSNRTLLSSVNSLTPNFPWRFKFISPMKN